MKTTAFINDLKAWAGKDAPMLDTMIQQFLDKIKSQKEMVSGTKVPDISHRCARENVRLSELLQSNLRILMSGQLGADLVSGNSVCGQIG